MKSNQGCEKKKLVIKNKFTKQLLQEFQFNFLIFVLIAS